MRNVLICALAALITLISSTAAARPVQEPWNMLGDLSGSWRIVNPRTEGERQFRLQFRFISKNSTLVEIFGNPAKNVTQTMYHRDGERIIATHYCAQGNQPRLVLSPSATPGILRFSFWDVTNLKDKSDSHLVKLNFNMLDRNRMERRETYLFKGVEHETTLMLEREEQADAKANPAGTTE